MWSNRLANVFLDFGEFPENGELLDIGCGSGGLTWPWPSGVLLDDRYPSSGSHRALPAS